jgi:hypothetical protein
MRLPWGTAERVASDFSLKDYKMLGALSPEERCRYVPLLLGLRSKRMQLLQVNDPKDAFPNYAEESRERINDNLDCLRASGWSGDPTICNLLDPEERMLQIVHDLAEGDQTIVLDITSLPKRFFCFILKRLLLGNQFRNVIVTYTQGGPSGYALGHLAEDAMSPDYLPGYAPPLVGKSNTLVIAVGFECLGLGALLDEYSEKNPPKLLLSFSSDLEVTARQWDTIRQLVAESPDAVRKNNLEVVAAWDVEQVYKAIRYWNEESDGMMLAPFGPKPHTLAMALFAIQNGCGMSYTQPKSYNPDYTTGVGSCWAYVTKWDGIVCYDRTALPI